MTNIKRIISLLLALMLIAALFTFSVNAASDANAEGTVTEEGTAPESTIGTEKYVPNIFESLKMMGLGMLGIFIVTGIIIVVIYALNYFTNKEPKEDTEEA